MPAAKQIKFLTRLRLLSLATVQELDEAVRTEVRTDLKKADLLADSAIAIAENLGDQESLAFALRAKANTLGFLGERSRASELNTHAVQLFHQLGQPIEEGRTLSTSIQPLILLGEYDRALAAANRARAIFSASGDTLRLARLDLNVGNIFHRQDRFKEALSHYQQAYSQLAPDKDAEGILVALHNMAVCFTSLNESEKALDAYAEVRSFCQDHDMPLAMAQAEYNVAYLYFLKGEYGLAIDLLRKAHETAQQVGDTYHVALCGLDLSEIYLQLNLNQDAAELAQEAYTQFDQAGIRYEAAKALCHWAIALSQKHQNFRALRLFAQARGLFVAERNSVWPSLIDLYEAFAHFNDGRLTEAWRNCSAALAFFKPSSPDRASLCHLLLAKIALKSADLKTAREECRMATEEFTGREAPILGYQAALVHGQIEEAGHDFAAAKKHYLAAKEILEKLRHGIRGEELRISFLENKLEIYENLVGLSVMKSAGNNYEQAWNYMEQAKSRNLLETIVKKKNAATLHHADASGLSGRILKLREELNWYYHRIEIEQTAHPPAPGLRILELRQLAEQAEKNFLRLLRELPAGEAETAGGEDIKPESLASVRETIGPDAVLIEYFRVRDQILVTVITQNDLEIFSVTTASQVSQLLSMLQQQFSHFHLGTDHIQQLAQPLIATTSATLHDLYVQLIAPIRESLKARHLIIVPHELLHAVPFHALFDGSNYLIDSFTVSYAPSASIYVQCCKRPAHASGMSLVLGVSSEQTPRVDEELRSVAEILPDARLLNGADASASALRDNAPQSALIHIATHGFFRQDQPMFSGVRLGDTFLTLYDLYTLNLPANHVTLSGCSTGLNAIASGDEMMGLTRGLLYAGARSLLLSLWDVNDTSTADFMTDFYKNYIDSNNLAVAQQKAIQKARERHVHPYYWAPFVLMGGIPG